MFHHIVVEKVVSVSCALNFPELSPPAIIIVNQEGSKTKLGVVSQSNNYV